MTDEPAAPTDSEPDHAAGRPGPFPPKIGKPVPHPPQPVIEGVVVSDSEPARGPVVQPPVLVKPLVPPPVTVDNVHQEPVAGTFIGGAIFAFLARSLVAVLSLGYIVPVTGLLAGLWRGHRGLFVLDLLGEFLVLAVVCFAGVIIGTTATAANQGSIRRALFMGRVYFWGTAYYLAASLVGGVVVAVTDVLGGGLWLIVISLTNLPLLFLARTIIRRTRWVTGSPD
jgi:hypothetical protein